MLTSEERQARYERLQMRLEKKARIKKARKDVEWNSKPIDINPTGVES